MMRIKSIYKNCKNCSFIIFIGTAFVVSILYFFVTLMEWKRIENIFFHIMAWCGSKILKNTSIIYICCYKAVLYLCNCILCFNAVTFWWCTWGTCFQIDLTWRSSWWVPHWTQTCSPNTSVAALSLIFPVNQLIIIQGMKTKTKLIIIKQ